MELTKTDKEKGKRFLGVSSSIILCSCSMYAIWDSCIHFELAIAEQKATYCLSVDID